VGIVDGRRVSHLGRAKDYREGYNNGDIERVLSVFAESFTNISDGDEPESL
jgi:hypothetical protein